MERYWTEGLGRAMEQKPVMEPLRRPSASAMSINTAVINAILLRDIRVRAGPYYTGFLMLLLMPLVHLVAIVILYHFFNRIAPVGTDQVVYFGVSIIPFVLFIYPARQIVIGVMENRPLLYFGRVKLFDIFVSRFVLESVNAIVIFIFVVFILSIFSDGFLPRDWTGVLMAVAATLYLAFCVGCLNALLAYVIPFWFIAFNISAPIFWASSGIIFYPAALPAPYGQWLAFNPLLQCVEWMRYSYYDDYPDKLLNVPYLLGFATALLGIALIAEKLGRRALRSG